MSPAIAPALLTAFVVLSTAAASAQDAGRVRRFSFGPEERDGFVRVPPEETWSAERGYGFDLGSRVDVVAHDGTGFVRGSAGRPFFFSAAARPGVYRVTAVIGDSQAASRTTIKAETRRLMHEAVSLSPGETRELAFLVHVRDPSLPDGGRVRLKPRESEPILFLKWDREAELTFTELNWDDRLTIEICEETAALVSLTIEPVDNATTLFIIGDSTVADQMMEPWGAWGHYLPRWLQAPVVVANHSEHGETTASFIGERRWDRVLSEIKPGDWVFMQFGINDQRMPVEDFKGYFVRYINETRAKQAFPVLVTSQNLKRLDEQGHAVQTLRNFPDAMREVAGEMNVPLIDLNAMSMKFYEALGRDKLDLAFVDGTHHSNYGAYELAKCVVQGIIDSKLPLAEHVVDGWTTYDPSQPADPANFKLPVDPQMDPARPGGPGAPNGQGPQAGGGGGGGRRGGQRRGG